MRRTVDPLSTEAPLDWCRARLLVPGNPLALTLPYAPPSSRDALLALRTVISEIAAVPGEVSDADVARRKLGWWRQALRENLPHPAVQAFIDSGAARNVPADLLEAVIGSVAGAVDSPRFEQLAELQAHGLAIAGPAARAEACLVAHGKPVSATVVERLEQMAAAGYRIRLVRDLVLDARHQRWSVPLEVQAEFQITRQQAADGEGGHRLLAMIRHLAALAERDRKAALEQMDPADAWQHRHAVLASILDARLARRIVRRPSSIIEQRLTSSGPMAALAVWRQARRLQRSSRKARVPERA